MLYKSIIITTIPFIIFMTLYDGTTNVDYNTILEHVNTTYLIKGPYDAGLFNIDIDLKSTNNFSLYFINGIRSSNYTIDKLAFKNITSIKDITIKYRFLSKFYIYLEYDNTVTNNFMGHINIYRENYIFLYLLLLTISLYLTGIVLILIYSFRLVDRTFKVDDIDENIKNALDGNIFTVNNMGEFDKINKEIIKNRKFTKLNNRSNIIQYGDKQPSPYLSNSTVYNSPAVESEIKES